MITVKGCSSLASALSANPSHLKELDLTYNYPGESGVKLLSARLEDPQCALNTLRSSDIWFNECYNPLKASCVCTNISLCIMVNTDAQFQKLKSSSHRNTEKER
ncbi:hypothetical protein NFI96_006851 [Prochilodus magdalenae]|nr:hypothetical protein NFI96_006851 [Prochilodus magdalenae]